MRFLLVHQAFATPEEGGGTRHYEFARRCVERGHAFTVVASTVSYLTGRPTGAPGTSSGHEDLEGIRLLRVPVYAAHRRGTVWRVLSFCLFMLTSAWRALRAGPTDLVIGTSPPLFQAVSAWAVAVLRRRPFLLEIRDLWPDFAIELGVLRNRVLIALSRWLERFLYARAAHLLVNSPGYRDHLLAEGVPAEKMTLIANGVDAEMFDPEAKGERIRERHGLRGKFVVGYAGALGQANDIATLLRAMARLRDRTDIHLLLVGDGKERTHLEQRATELGLSNVTFTGARPKQEVAEYLAASDACTATLRDIPLFRTTYPNKIFDYMAAGRPIVLAIDGVIREVVEAAGCGVFVPPGDDVALALAVEQMSAHREQREAMGRAGRRYVIEHFNRDAQADDFVALAERMAGRGCCP